MSIIYKEDYELAYDIYLAENDLFDSLISYHSMIINEDYGLISLQESLKDTVMNYLGKIAQALQHAWEKFKDILSNPKEYLQSVGKRLGSFTSKFKIHNYIDANMDVLSQIKVLPLNYGEMKEYLNSEKDYINKYYPNLASTGQENVEEAIKSLVFKGTKDVECNQEFVKGVLDRLVNLLPGKKSAEIEADIKNINTSNNTISNMATTIQSAEEVKQEMFAFYESFIIEAENEEKTPSVSDMKIEDNKEGESKTNNTNGLITHMKNYMSVSSKIISGKMKCYRQIFAFDMKVLRHAIPENKEKKETTEQQNTTSNNTKITVET